jgi:hypothetical protein
MLRGIAVIAADFVLTALELTGPGETNWVFAH